MVKEKINKCDIVMPVYNNEAVLKDTLTALFEQTVPLGWQMRLVVVDDGSTDHTGQVIESIKAPVSWEETVVIKQDHAGAAEARNKGIESAQGDVVFFLGADIVLLTGALEKHLRWHGNNPGRSLAVLGMVKWDPRLNPSPFMEWMVHGGQQNNFDDLLGSQVVDAKHFFYGSHLSIRRSLLQENRFSDKFDVYGWEDLELGRRLSNKGVKLHVLHEAVALHRHYYEVESILKRQYYVGQGVIIYQKMYPEEVILPRSGHWKHWRRLVIIHSGLLSLLRTIVRKTGRKYSTPNLFLWVTAMNYWQGVYSSKDSHNDKKTLVEQ